MHPGDRLVCAFTTQHRVGDRFTEWPLHVTIVPWFRLALESEDLAKELEQALAGIKSFQVVLVGASQFGHSKGKTAHLVQLPTSFIQIEQIVRDGLKRHGAWLVDETTRLRRDYRPHVTNQKSEQTQMGATFMCDRLYIVEQKGGYKEVVATVELA
ncbi:MAG: hypothetical protein JWL89_377 [Candidatus Saccharibacteria bacterium]|nr:hypothetical protein [Candidatus Saccharibacteria bacterium]